MFDILLRLSDVTNAFAFMVDLLNGMDLKTFTNMFTLVHCLQVKLKSSDTGSAMRQGGNLEHKL